MIQKLFEFLTFEIDAPKTYGFFHLISFVIIAFLTTLLCIKCKNSSERTERRIAFWTWILLLVIETYKQIVYIFVLEDGVFSVDYGWHGFPFQLCSTPLYTLPFIIFLPRGKLRDAFIAFYGTFVFLGGISVCIYPGNVFVETLGINIHTMIWHGSQVILGAYFNFRRFSNKKQGEFKRYFLPAVPIFLSFVAVALILNISIYHVFLANGIEDTFNMFFVSPYFDCIFPVLDLIQAHTPYPVFLLSYVVFLTALSFALLYIEVLIIRIIRKKSEKKQRNAT